MRTSAASRHHESDPTRRQCGTNSISGKKIVIEYLLGKNFEHLQAAVVAADFTI